MTKGELEALDPGLWFESLGRLRQPARGREGRIQNRLRQSYYLANLAPPPFSALVRCELAEDTFEALLEQRAYESAAISLIGRILSFDVARTWPGPCVSARVWVEDIHTEAQVASNCVACALLQAWVELLLQFSKRTPEMTSPALPKARRRSRSAQPRKPISH